MNNFLLIALGGGLGASARYGLSQLSARILGGVFPWGTLAANVLGGLAMGVLFGYMMARTGASPALRLFLGVGVLGGFTTFSSFSLETFLMIERQDYGAAASYILASVILSIFALFLGVLIARKLWAV